MASGVFTHFGPGPNGTIRFQTRFEDDTGRVGDSDRFVEPQADILGIPWADLVAAGYGTLEYQEDGTASIRPVDSQAEDTTPAWASALLVTLNEMRAEMRERFDALGTQLDRIVDRTEKSADELQQMDEAMARIIAKMTSRTPKGDGE